MYSAAEISVAMLVMSVPVPPAPIAVSSAEPSDAVSDVVVVAAATAVLVVAVVLDETEEVVMVTRTTLVART